MLGCKRVKRGRQWPDRKRQEHQGSVVGRLTGANPRLNFIPGLFNSFVQKPVGINFSIFFRACSHNIVDKKITLDLFFEALRSEIKFHANPGLS